MCQRLRSLLKYGRTNFLGKFLSLEIGISMRDRTKIKVTNRFSVSAVTVVSLRKLVLPLPCQEVLRSLSACSHVVPVLGQLRHASTEQHPQHVNTSMQGEGGSCCFSKFSFTQKTRISLNVLSKHVIKQEIIIINPRLFWSNGQI